MYIIIREIYMQPPYDSVDSKSIIIMGPQEGFKVYHKNV